MSAESNKQGREDAREELTLVIARVDFYVQRPQSPAADAAWREIKAAHGWDHTKIPLYDILVFCQTHFGVGIDGLAAYTRSAAP